MSPASTSGFLTTAPPGKPQHFIFMAENILLFEYSAFCLSVHLLMDILGCFHLWALVSIAAVNIRSQYLCEHLGVELLGLVVVVCLAPALPHCFQGGCTVLHSHQQCARSLRSLHACQHLVLSIFSL